MALEEERTRNPYLEQGTRDDSLLLLKRHERRADWTIGEDNFAAQKAE